MDGKLQVAELRDILSKAAAPAPARTNKQDLIARVLATPTAIEIYHNLYPSAEPVSSPAVSTPVVKVHAPSSNDDLLAPPEDLDWTTVETSDATPATPFPQNTTSLKSSPPTKLAQGKPGKPTAAPVTLPPALVPPSDAPAPERPAVIDDELERRKARAARFGIALVEPKRSPQRQVKKNNPTKTASSQPDDAEKMRKRAERFGLSNSDAQATGTGTKRSAPVEEVDAEEMERRRKRAERFKIPATLVHIVSGWLSPVKFILGGIIYRTSPRADHLVILDSATYLSTHELATNTNMYIIGLSSTSGYPACRAIPLGRRFAPYSTHAREENTQAVQVLPESGFFTPFWRNILVFSLAAVGFYKWAPRPDEDAYLTRWLTHYATHREFWDRMNEIQLLRSHQVTVDTVVQMSAQRPSVVRYRYPQTLEQASPHLQAVGAAHHDGYGVEHAA
ncbi:hypothetical protein ID866_6389 [Astraeus odoratus]|nr:hypothetical protein ID866_6389 [Astraeus odoratus]